VKVTGVDVNRFPESNCRRMLDIVTLSSEFT